MASNHTFNKVNLKYRKGGCNDHPNYSLYEIMSQII